MSDFLRLKNPSAPANMAVNVQNIVKFPKYNNSQSLV